MLPPAVKLWGTALLTALYSFRTIRRQESSVIRFLQALPVVIIYLALPVLVYDYRTECILSALVACIFSWLGSFKILMLVFSRGPLVDPAVAESFIRFTAVLCSPINLKPSRKPMAFQQEKKSSYTFFGQSVLKVALLLVTVQIVDKKDSLHTLVYHFFCYINLYLFASLIMDVFAAMTSWIFGLELLSDFDKPFLSQSLSEFWARRWNLTVSGLLRASVYEPLLEWMVGSKGHSQLKSQESERANGLRRHQQGALANGSLSRGEDKILQSSRSMSTRVRPRLKHKCLPVLATFAVSGVMHELAFWYMSHTVTGEMTAFFTLHGLALILERWMQASLAPAIKPPKLVSITLTMLFCFFTAEWLFLPPLCRGGVDNRVVEELKQGLFLS